MLQNAYFVAKIGADTAENEQHFAEILPTDALWRGLRQRKESKESKREKVYGFEAPPVHDPCAVAYPSTNSF